jgi:AcrR family transcriptional regulator
MARTGRRPGASGARDRILDAARARFAADGYAGATIRAIAGQADVDPALVHHYFGPKTQLFAAVMALPPAVDHVPQRMLDGPTDRLGERMIRAFLEVWDAPRARDQMRALLRAALTEDHAAATLREFVLEAILGPVTRALAVPDAELRATLAASQVVGLAVARYVVGIEPLASTDREVLVAAYAPTLQRYLLGDLALPEPVEDPR